MMDELKQQFYEVMHKYQKPFSEEGVTANLTQWYEQKQGLLQLLRRHPLWNEKELAIVFRVEERREIDRITVDETRAAILELGRRACADDTVYENFETALRAATADYARIPNEYRLDTIRQYGGIKCAPGQKASRIINRLCLKFHLDQIEEEAEAGEPDNRYMRTVKPYNALFARLADALNPAHIEKTAVLSIHPCDFLEMSNRDNTWSSCHCLEGGGYRGGPAYYIKNVLGNKPMAALFAVLISVTFGLIFNSVQANTITISLQAAFGLDRFVMGCIIAALTGIVIFGGVARIAKVAEWMVPIMAGLYLLIALGVTLMNIEKLPQVFNAIFSSAFDLQAVAGGGMGAALMTGIKRGLFSNEAGMGSVPNAAATASASHPVKQGLIQAFGVFVDTLLVCSASAFIVLLSDGYTEGKLTGIELVQQSLSQHLGPWAPSFLAGMICLFAFSSIVGNYYYGEINIGFISKNYMTLMLFRVFVVGMVLFGSVAKVALVWDLADLFMALMAITNLVAIAILGKYAYIALHDYMDQKRAGIVEPEFDPAILPSQRGIEVWQKE